MNNILADQLEIWGFEKDLIVFSDGSLGFGLELVPVDVTCWSDEAINQIAQKSANFLNGLPSLIDIQFIQDIKRGNATVIDGHETLGQEATNSAAQILCHKRAEKLREEDNSGLLPSHTLKVFIRRPPIQALINKPKFFSQSKKFNEISEERFERELIQTERLKESMTQELSQLDLSVTTIGANELAKLIYEQWNPARPIALDDYDPDDLRSSLLFTDLAIQEKGFSLGDMHHRVISLKILPDQTFASMGSLFRQLPFDSRVFLNIQIPDQAKEIQSLQTQRRIAYSMVSGKRTGVSDLESQAKFQDLETLLEQMVAQGEKVFHVSLNVLLRSQDKNDLENQVAQTLMTLRGLGGAEGMEESLAAFDIFSQISIPNARCKERSKRIKTSNLCDLFPLYGPWRGHAKPSILLRHRMGSLLSLDPFDAGLVNANQLISGGSGSGKSYLTNALLLQMLKENPQVFFIDIGGSYKKLCENLSGQYIALDLSKDVSINPFDLLPGETTPSSEKTKFLVGLLELITKEDGVERLPKLERAEIEEAIGQVYQTSKLPKLSDLRNILLNHINPDIKRYGKILAPWCGETPFGKFLDRPTNVELHNPIVAFDLQLDSYPELQSACLYIITDLVWREVQKDRSRKKFIIFDECWRLLKSDSGVAFIELVFRTCRKFFCSATAISQSLSDFSDSKIAGALLPNCSLKWLLMQNQNDNDKLKEVLGLNDNEIGLVQSLRQEKGYYSEAFLLAGPVNRSVTVISTLPEELWIATTDPRDLSAIEDYQKKYPEKSKMEVISDLAEIYPAGIAKAS